MFAQKPNDISSFTIQDSPWLPTQTKTLLSPNQTFAAGFRKALNAASYTFSIWFQKSRDKTVIWSLKQPVPPSSPLTIFPNGTLFLPGPPGGPVNLFPDTARAPSNPTLFISESGELTFGKWSSFDSPTHTLLPNQPIIPTHTLLSSNSKYTLVNASVLMFNGTEPYWSVNVSPNPTSFTNLTTDGFLREADSMAYLMSDVGNSNISRRLTLDPDGNIRVYSLNDTSGAWKVVWQAVIEQCTIKGICRDNSVCVPSGNGNATTCVCLPGYNVNQVNGCDIKKKISNGGKFLRLDYVVFGSDAAYVNNTEYVEYIPINFDDCRSRCVESTSCVGFTYTFNGKRDCFNWFKVLRYGYWSPGSEKSTFVKVDSSETDISGFTGMTSMIDTTCPVKISLPVPERDSKTTARNLAIIGTLFALELTVGILSFWAFLRRYSKYRDMARTFGLEFLPAGGPKRFSYAELKVATNDFSNVVGRGGFGIVYRGELHDGRIIAVKKLKNVVGVAEAEFWGEVTIIARMHHLNLVRMWGFCAEKEQRMLVYEYIPNGSLDKFLFHDESGKDVKLDWGIRYRITLGVARAIAYLHEECLEWVLHCDIKPENILLEDDFCPKVSDFGLSKLTNKKDIVTMSRMRGTRGYMAPEWVTHREPITAKADVYSFGVVLLEIVTGTRSSEFQRSSVDSEDWYFPRWAYEKVYVEKRVEDMLDPIILESYDNREHFPMVERMVKTAMWCLQDKAETRPSMGKVAKMLEGSVEITEPGKPSIFYLGNE